VCGQHTQGKKPLQKTSLREKERKKTKLKLMDSSLAWFQDGSSSLGYSLHMHERDICSDFRLQARPQDGSSRSRGLQLNLDPGLPSVLGFLLYSAARRAFPWFPLLQ